MRIKIIKKKSSREQTPQQTAKRVKPQSLIHPSLGTHRKWCHFSRNRLIMHEALNKWCSCMPGGSHHYHHHHHLTWCFVVRYWACSAHSVGSDQPTDHTRSVVLGECSRASNRPSSRKRVHVHIRDHHGGVCVVVVVVIVLDQGIQAIESVSFPGNISTIVMSTL